MQVKGPKLTGSASAAYSILRDLGPDGKPVVEVMWRDSCVNGRNVSAADDPDSRRRAFKRAVEMLVRGGWVAFRNGAYILATSSTTSDYQVGDDFDEVEHDE